MKRLFTLMGCALLATLGASAQNPYVALQGAVEDGGGWTVSQPRTMLVVDVEVECDRVIAGPYARYAQKYLGVRAPLSDKTTWTVKDAQVALGNAATTLYAGAERATEQHKYAYTEAAEEFPRMPVDKTAMLVPALEDAARDAAATIYSLRKHRMELITGDAGENVFGQGLQAALDEIARLEQEYLELFLGTRTISTASHRYVVYPQADKMQYVVCRFSATDGILPASDLSGEMVLLKIDPTAPQTEQLAAAKVDASSVPCRVAALSECQVICNGSTFGSVTLPIFEFGRTIYVNPPRRK